MGGSGDAERLRWMTETGRYGELCIMADLSHRSRLRCSAIEGGGADQFASRLIGDREIVRRYR